VVEWTRGMGGLLFCGKKIKNSIEKNLKNFKKIEKKIYKIPGGWVDGWVGKS
jgi:hypothetical protein